MYGKISGQCAISSESSRNVVSDMRTVGIHIFLTSEILPWLRTHAIVPRLSREGFIRTLVVLNVVKLRHCYVKVTSSCEIVS